MNKSKILVSFLFLLLVLTGCSKQAGNTENAAERVIPVDTYHRKNRHTKRY
jgi:PBP1b-binding outer membrane lipoprotein LpoB